MRAAAEKLTPVLLELGGQNPAIVDETANVPDAAAKLVWASMASVLRRTQAKPVVLAGMGFGVIAMLLFTRLSPHGTYAGQVLSGLLLAGLAAGCIFAPALSPAPSALRQRTRVWPR